jgi:hypothetical protein
MRRFAQLLTVAVIALAAAGIAVRQSAASRNSVPGAAVALSGEYLETRTCDVYTGPCFANAQSGLCGRQAILAWSIDRGEFQGVDLAGLKVVVSVLASDTLGFGGGLQLAPEPIKWVVYVDKTGSESQRAALVEFAKERAPKLAGEVVRVEAIAIEMSLDHIEMVGDLKAGKKVRLKTRKLRKGDCVCANETAFYPPLVEVENSEPAYTVDGEFFGLGLGITWSNSKSRSAYLATFAD